MNNVYLVDGLEFNLLSRSQLCDKGNLVSFDSTHCVVQNKESRKVNLYGVRIENVYAIDLNDISSSNLACFKASQYDENWLWHQRLGHASMHTIQKLARNELVRGFSKYNFENDHLCDACGKARQVQSSFKLTNSISTSKPLELLHMDLRGPIPVLRVGRSKCVLVIVDDFSQFTWVSFLKEKNEVLKEFAKICKQTQVFKNSSIVFIRSDHGKEFDQKEFIEFCINHGITHNFSAPRTPQQNGVVERKNRTLEDVACTMMCESNASQNL